jgi:hypothetical protein
MTDQNISSVLVEDYDQNIVGLITERDIVQRFTLLEVEDKLTRQVNTIMSRPVVFVPLSNFHDEIVKLHLEKKFRHFPILEDHKEAKSAHVVGIVSITDVARFYMQKQLVKKQSSLEKSDHDHESPVAVLAHQPGTAKIYAEIFRNLGFQVGMIDDLNHFVRGGTHDNYTLIFDMDGYSERDLHLLIPVAVKFRGQLLLTTSNTAVIPTFRKYLNAERQDIAAKPIDITYVSWLLHKRLGTEKFDK